MAETEHALPVCFEVGGWRVDGNALTVSRNGASRTLEPRAFAVLRYLAERPGELVTIDSLMDALWAGSVVTPNAVSRVIAQLRKALSDDAKQPRYIETVARQGYRLVASVRPASEARALKPSRFASVLSVVSLLALTTWLLWPKPQREATVAVLPFQNLTGEDDLGYLADGVAEAVINTLTEIPELRVSAQTVSFRYRGDDADPRNVARDLGVSYVVLGSVRRSGPNMRVSAQLVTSDSGVNVWSHTAEHDVLEVFESQDEITAGAARALGNALGFEVVEREDARAPDPEAYDLYLRGRYIWHRRGNEPMQPAIDYLAEAVRIDPDFARGWAALASAYLSYPSYSREGYETWPLAKDAAEKAMALDPGIPEVYGVLGTFAEREGDWAESHRLYARGVELGANSATAHYWYGEHLAKTGRYVESVQHMQEALALDPAYQAPQVDLAFAHLAFGDVEGGTEIFREKWLGGFQNVTCWSGNFVSAVLRGDVEQAMQWIDVAPIPEPAKPLMRRFVTADAGDVRDPELIAAITATRGPRPDYRMAVFMGSRLGADDEVIALLETRLERGLQIDPRPFWTQGITITRHPRFPDVLERMGLVEYWRSVEAGDVCRIEGEATVCDAAGLTPERMTALVGEDEA